MGTSGKSLRILATISGVLAAPDTLRISAPAASRPAMSMSPETMVVITGMSTTAFILVMVSLVMGALTTTPEAPWCSEYSARRTDRSPLVMPPPTPTNTGTSDTLMMAWVMEGWGVKG